MVEEASGLSRQDVVFDETAKRLHDRDSCFGTATVETQSHGVLKGCRHGQPLGSLRRYFDGYSNNVGVFARW